MTVYKQNNKAVNKGQYDKQQKLINLYNQVNGTDYNTASVGLSKERINRQASNIPTNNNANNLLFGHYRRTGTAYNPNRTGKR